MGTFHLKIIAYDKIFYDDEAVSIVLPAVDGEIQIMANPHLSAADFKLEIECNDKYYQKLLSTKSKYNVRFSAYSQTGSWAYPLYPAHAREAVAMMLNYGYMFSSKEFAE